MPGNPCFGVEGDKPSLPIPKRYDIREDLGRISPVLFSCQLARTAQTSRAGRARRLFLQDRHPIQDYVERGLRRLSTSDREEESFSVGAHVPSIDIRRLEERLGGTMIKRWSARGDVGGH